MTETVGPAGTTHAAGTAIEGTAIGEVGGDLVGDLDTAVFGAMSVQIVGVGVVSGFNAA